MPNNPNYDLTNQPISSTFQNVLQTDGFGNFFNGLGDVVTITLANNNTSGSSGLSGASGSSGTSGESGPSGPSGSSGTSGSTFTSGTSGYLPKFTGQSTISPSIIYDNGTNIGIGTDTPDQRITIVSDNSSSTFINTVYENGLNTFPPAFVGRKARGTLASPTTVQSGDYLFLLGGRGYDGTSFPTSSNGTIVIGANGNFTTTSTPTYAAIELTASGSITRSEVVRITGNGNVGIGTTNPLAATPTRRTLSITDTTNDTTVRLEGSNAVIAEWFTNGGLSGIGTRSSNSFVLIANNATRLTVDTSGNVGIGTTTPQHTLNLGNTNTGISINNNIGDGVTNFERVRMYWNANQFYFETGAGGTGNSSRIINITAGNTLSLGGGGAYLGMSAQTGGRYQFNAGPAGLIGNSVVASFNGGHSAGSNITTSIQIAPIINQSSTAGYRMLWISPFQNTIGSGSKLLIDAGTNTAASGTGTHTSRFVVTSDGNVGIGISAPTALLHTFGSMAVPIVAERNITANTTIQYKNPGFNIWEGMDGAGNFGISRTSADLGNFSDMLRIDRASGKLNVRTGTNTSTGTGTLVNGTVTISNTCVTANSIILLTNININESSAIGTLTQGTITAGTSFVVNSRKQNNPSTIETADVSTFQYLIIN